MGKAMGFQCDYKKCNKFEVADILPTGWMTLRMQLDSGKNDTLEVCSNHCLARLAVERAEADGNPIRKNLTARYSEDGLAAMRRNGRRTSHLNNHVRRSVLDAECEFCQEITAPLPETVDA